MRSRELTKIGIETVGDLLKRKPLSYIYPGVTSLADAKEGMVVVKAEIKSVVVPYKSAVEATLVDESGTCKAIWYNQLWLLDSLHRGLIATFCGKYKGGTIQQPKWTTYDGGMDQIVGGQYGTHHNTIRAALKEVLANMELPDMIGGFNRTYCYQGFHFPSNSDVQKQAFAKLKFDEALTLQLALQERRRGREQCAGVRIEI